MKNFSFCPLPLNFLKTLSDKGFLSKAQYLLAGTAVISAATLALTQEAKAATAYGFSQVSFNAFFDLNDDNLNILTPKSDNIYDFDTNNPNNTPDPSPDFFDSARYDSGFDPNFIFLNTKEEILTPDGVNYSGVLEAYLGPPNSNATMFTDNIIDSQSFTAKQDDVLSLNYNLDFDALAEIEGFNPDDTVGALARMDVAVELFREDNSLVTELLIETASAIVGQENGSDQDTESNLGGIIDFTVEDDGEYFIGISIRQAVDAFNVSQPVPEPTSVIGLLGIGALGLGLKRKKQNDHKA